MFEACTLSTAFAIFSILSLVTLGVLGIIESRTQSIGITPLLICIGLFLGFGLLHIIANQFCKYPELPIEYGPITKEQHDQNEKAKLQREIDEVNKIMNEHGSNSSGIGLKPAVLMGLS